MHSPSAQGWTTGRRVALRFVLAYFVVALFPMAPALESAEVAWVCRHLLGVSAPRATGITETLIYFLMSATIALAVTLIWSAVDRRAKSYAVLHDRLRIGVRYLLATIMIFYGEAKLFPGGQFGPADLSTLLRPFGRFTPMDVLWEFMGYSYAYTLFAGLGELAGSVLLFFRRTTTLGALILVAVLSNVALLDFAYDVPPKVNATNYLLMALFLLAPDARRLFDAFVLNRALPAANLGEAATTPRGRRFRRILKTLIVSLTAVVLPVAVEVIGRVLGFATPPRPSLFGIYDVQEFHRNGIAVPPLITDTTRWRRVIVDERRTVAFQGMNDRMEFFRVADDTARHRWSLTGRADTLRKLAFSYAAGPGGALELDGALSGDSVHLRLSKVDHTKFPLLSHRF